MATLWPAGVVPLLLAAGALDKEQVAVNIGTVGQVVVGRVALVARTNHVLGDTLAAPAVKSKVLPDEMGRDAGIRFDVPPIACDTALQLLPRVQQDVTSVNGSFACESHVVDLRRG